MAGFVAGVLSIGAWLVAQMPQIVSNFRNRSADALSAWFLAEWLLASAFTDTVLLRAVNILKISLNTTCGCRRAERAVLLACAFLATL